MLKKKKKRVFYLLMVFLIILVPVIVSIGFYSFRKLTFSYNYCGSYGKLDEELGWKLKENTSSCLSLSNLITGETYFDSKIFTNEMGFRDIATNRKITPGSIAAIGDSWTFGYGINYEETFPYLLSQKINFPVANMGIPAYGSGSNLLLFERYVKQIRPSVVIYYTNGLWTRSLCLTKTKPVNNLIPCFWWNDKIKQIELIKPLPGKVFQEAENHSYPGGALTAGYDSLEYFFIIKPLAVIEELKTKALKIINTPEKESTNVIVNRATIVRKLKHLTDINFPQRKKTYIPEAGDTKVFSKIESVFKYTLKRYAKLAKQNNFVFLIIDTTNFYHPFVKEVNKEFGVSIIHIGVHEWNKDIVDPGEKLPPKLRKVPKDGHYAIGYNRLIAEKIASILKEKSVRLKLKNSL